MAGISTSKDIQVYFNDTRVDELSPVATASARVQFTNIYGSGTNAVCTIYGDRAYDIQLNTYKNQFNQLKNTYPEIFDSNSPADFTMIFIDTLQQTKETFGGCTYSSKGAISGYTRGITEEQPTVNPVEITITAKTYTCITDKTLVPAVITAT